MTESELNLMLSARELAAAIKTLPSNAESELRTRAATAAGLPDNPDLATQTPGQCILYGLKLKSMRRAAVALNR